MPEERRQSIRDALALALEAANGEGPDQRARWEVLTAAALRTTRTATETMMDLMTAIMAVNYGGDDPMAAEFLAAWVRDCAREAERDRSMFRDLLTAARRLAGEPDKDPREGN